MAVNEENESVLVVFEYTKGSYLGGRLIVHFPAAEIEKVKQDQANPDANTKIVAIGVSEEEAQAMCQDALLHSGVICRRIKSLADDPDVPPEVVHLEAATLLSAALSTDEN